MIVQQFSLTSNITCKLAQQNYIMRVKGEIQLDTAVNSPTKRSLQQNNFSNLHKDYVFSNSFISQQPSKFSQTQKAIYSHQLIREVMQSSRNRSVWHEINRIDQKKPLYARPIKFEQSEFKFDSIPSKNLMYASECSAKIKKIKEELRETTADSQRQIESKKGQVGQNLKKRPSSASGRINTKNPKVNVAALASYNFSSVNARNSLGFSKINRQQNLIKDIEQNEHRRFCCSQRNDKILEKSSARRFLKHAKNQNAIMSDFISDTDSYLNIVNREKEENTLIYNQCAKKLNLIKEYMEQQKTNYDDAAFIVNEIESRQKVPKVKEKPVVKKGEFNDERGLEKRRMPVQYKPLMVKHFAFIQ